ncbi:TrbI/VirB10 family protein [Nostoc sp. FACHB-190]|uniref:TrbI/VirB10 family protein n=1 Tax=Nostoc sp. FACHB-190 TaxID=2692838 RepID=UPI001F5580D2|nr:TrbI/VirB10 family protein [Nostoc sp. FACHB-190]
MPNQIVEQEQSNPAMTATNSNGNRSEEFARMNGVEIKEATTTDLTSAESTNNVPPNELEEIVTTRPVASHPILKGLTISGGVLLIVIVFGAMISSLTDALNSPSNQPASGIAKTQPTKASSEEDEKGELKTAIAITSQKSELQAIVKKDNAVPATPLPIAKPTTTAAVTVRAQPVTPRQPQVYQAPSKSYQTADNVSPRRVFSPAPSTPQPQAAVNNSRPLPVKSTPTAKDPMQEWIAASNVGIYSSNNDESNYDQPDLKNLQVEGGIGVKPVNGSYPNQNQNVSFSIPANHGGKQVLVGTRATGVMETPIAWVSSNSNQEQQNSLIRLTQPLKGFDGSEVLPKGSYVVATISTTNSEVVQMKATSALINSNGGTLEKQLPTNSILILGKDGNLLKAKSRKGGNNLGASLMASLLSGLSKAAEIQNRANTQTTISSLGTTTTIDNPDKDLVAGFAQGSINEVLERMKTANEQQLRGLEQQQQVFVIEAGKQVQIFVNKSISI